jgi:hypothetical protein
MNPVSPVLKSEADERSLRLLILQKAESIGPSVTTIVENIWVRAVMTALYDIERFLKLAWKLLPAEPYFMAMVTTVPSTTS